MRRFGRTFLAVAGLLVVGSAAEARKPAPPSEAERVEFVMANFQFTLLHELSHVAIWDVQPPIIGPEEYAADYLATISLLRPLEAPAVGADKWVEFALKAADA